MKIVSKVKRIECKCGAYKFVPIDDKREKYTCFDCECEKEERQ